MSARGFDRLTRYLEGVGVRHVFGLPGTQNVALFEALRTSSIRTVPATSELAASFMAVGYARASGEPGVLVTIPGPGFTFALPGLAEARLDSVPLLHIVVHRPLRPGRRFQHQEIPHREMAGPVVKDVIEIRSSADFPELISHAWTRARVGEPGPVSVLISAEVLDGDRRSEDGPAGGRAAAASGHAGGSGPPAAAGSFQRGPTQDPGLQDLVRRLSVARRPVLYLGLGSLGASEGLQQLLHNATIPFFTTPSARGVIPEDHPLCLGFDFDRGGLGTLNELLDTADLILALGCKLGHNGTGGFVLRLSPDRLVHVNTDAEALGANYETVLSLCGPVEVVVSVLLASMEPSGADHRSEPVAARGFAWTREEIARWRARIGAGVPPGPPEPAFPALPTGTVGDLVQILRAALPRQGIVVTDSGLHQMLVRRHLPVLWPRGLICPTDFQSMGFGLPAAVGAALAAPRRKVVAVIGDGGLAMSGMELLTLAREKLPVTVFVFNDGHLNLIRLQQERDFGYQYAVRLRNPDMEALAEAVGVGYFRLDSEVEEQIRAAVCLDRPTLVEVPLGESPPIRAVRRRAKARAAVRRALGQRALDGLKDLLHRLRG